MFNQSFQQFLFLGSFQRCFAIIFLKRHFPNYRKMIGPQKSSATPFPLNDALFYSSNITSMSIFAMATLIFYALSVN